MMKTILKLTWLFLLVFAVVGCTSDEDSGGPEEENPEYNLDALQGKWYRAYSNNPAADGMEVTVTDNQGTVTNPAGSNFPQNSNKWKDILAVAQNEFEHGELGSDGMYYSGFMKLGVDDTLRINVGHSGAGNTQKWVRTYTEPEPEAHECTPYEADTSSGTLIDNWEEANEVDEYPGFFPAVSDPAGGYYVVTVTTDDSTTWIDIRKPGDESGAAIIDGSNGTTDDNVRKVAFSAEPGISYNLSLWPFFGYTFPEQYTISWEYHGIMDCYEPNNTYSEAKFIPKGETIEAFANLNNEGYGVQENHMDYYKIVLTEPAKIQVELEQSPSDAFIDIKFFADDQSPEILGTYTPISGNPDGAERGSLYIKTTGVRQPGTYYVRARSYWGGTKSVHLDQEGATLPDTWLTPYKFKVTAVQ